MKSYTYKTVAAILGFMIFFMVYFNGLAVFSPGNSETFKQLALAGIGVLTVLNGLVTYFFCKFRGYVFSREKNQSAFFREILIAVLLFIPFGGILSFLGILLNDIFRSSILLIFSTLG